MMLPLTRDQKLRSKQRWDNGLGLAAYEFKALEAWVLEVPTKQQEDLTKHLRLEQTDNEVKWATEEKIEVMTGTQKTWDRKLQYISKILGDLQEEVSNAPAPTAQEEEDTYETRSFNLHAQDAFYDEAQQVFVCWKVNFLRSIKYYKDAIASAKEKEEEKPDTGGAEAKTHSPTRPKNPSTADAKALRPDMLETSLPSMQMKDWYRKWTNYMEVSG